MLPFLARKQKKDTGISMVYREPDESKEQKDDGSESLEAISEEILKAFHANDKKLLTQSLRSFFEVCDSMPHEEGPHEEETE